MQSRRNKMTYTQTGDASTICLIPPIPLSTTAFHPNSVLCPIKLWMMQLISSPNSGNTQSCENTTSRTPSEKFQWVHMTIDYYSLNEMDNYTSISVLRSIYRHHHSYSISLQQRSILDSPACVSSIPYPLFGRLSHRRIRRPLTIRPDMSISGIRGEAQQINGWSYNRFHRHRTRYHKNGSQITTRKTHPSSQRRRKYSHIGHIISQSPPQSPRLSILLHEGHTTRQIVPTESVQFPTNLVRITSTCSAPFTSHSTFRSTLMINLPSQLVRNTLDM